LRISRAIPGKILLEGKHFSLTIEHELQELKVVFRLTELRVDTQHDMQTLGRLNSASTMRSFGRINEVNLKAYAEASVISLLTEMTRRGGNFPVMIRTDPNGHLHNINGCAVEWDDGELEFWLHGVKVPKVVVENPHAITREQFLEIRNAEVRRIIVEQIGTDKFVYLLDLEVIDTKIINNQEVTLLQTRKEDKVARDRLKFVRVIDTSTGRLYHICVEPHHTDAHEAVASTFNKTKEEYYPEIEA